MLRKFANARIELSRHLVLPILFLSLLSVPWFLGGRDPFGLVVIAGLSTLLFLSWLILSRDRALKLDWQPRLIIVPALVLIGWSLVSLIWTVSRYQTTLWLVGLMAASVVFVVARDVFRDARARAFYAKLLVLTSVAVSLIGLVMYVFGNYDRATSILFWPNPFATYLLSVLPIALGLALRKTTDRPNGWHAVSVLTIGMLVLTFSRAAWLVALIILVLAYWLSREKYRFVIVVSSIVLAGVALAIALSGTRSLLGANTVNVAGRLAEATTSQSVTDRLDYWREGTRMFADRPLLGWGAGSYSEVHPSYQQGAITATNNPHSSLVQAMVELGVVGFAAFLVFVAGVLLTFWRARREPRGYLTTAARLGFLALGLHSLVDLVSNYPTLMILGAILLALSLPYQKSAHAFRLRNRRIILTSAAVVAALLYLLSYSYQSYLARIDQDYIDVIASFDAREALGRYDEITARSFVQPDTLSGAAMAYIEAFDQQGKAGDKALLEKAARLATEATRQEPKDARHWYALAIASERLGKTSEALQAYQQAIALDPYNNPQYQISYARLLNQEGFTRGARDVLREITQEYTDSVIANRNQVRIKDRLAIAWTLQAELNVTLGDKQTAVEDVRRALELNRRYQPAIELEKKLQTLP